MAKMDMEQARFILRSFRPDGADGNDRDFEEALALAAENRELGEWLARERAFDAAFAGALASIPLPQTLRDDILGCLAAERGDFPQAEDREDSALIGALASIHPPAGLRDEILTAMDRTALAAESPAPFWKRFALPFAAAAGITLAILLTRGQTGNDLVSNPSEDAEITSGPVATPTINGRLSVDVVQAGFLRTFESPLFSLDENREDHQALLKHLRSRKLPCPGCLPPGLANVKGIGCRELIIDGKRGSLVCFDERENGIVHLVIFRRCDVSGKLPNRDRPEFSQQGHWAAARWEDDRNVFILLGTTEVKKLAALF
ncbi:MAG: hypothetical protein MUF13_08280 [Akkermansiaceae bacterium]|nr:hypothetical protein [Akkermansiaceae bacterium]